MIDEVKKRMLEPKIGKNEAENKLFQKMAYANALVMAIGNEFIQRFYDEESTKNLDRKIRVLESVYKKEKPIKELRGELLPILELYPKSTDELEAEAMW